MRPDANTSYAIIAVGEENVIREVLSAVGITVRTLRIWILSEGRQGTRTHSHPLNHLTESL